ncbi:hypothetical protein SGFS_058110 [Streptomyces graminofaciens]|uniref:Transport integral membrane protein n=1 Tax=Streptomyces graminofaciens TaxID=68212 RepID=A0ABM7FDJ1_9ACTN|nr:copper resistance protein CopC [Streptomyces graminofaciens]BBC34517.1 hypothetical protein SGFS_058110 [Streptomyces graminofaciens]
MLSGAVLVLFQLGFLLGGASPASAHAALTNSTPADGAVLDSAPRDITLSFTESVSLLDDSVRVIDPEQRAVDVGEPGRVKGRSETVRVTLPDGLAEGTYTIAWRVVSADSHPVSGALIFSVGEPSATAAALPADLTEDPLASSFYDITRYFAYGGLALLIGLVVFMAYVLGAYTDALRKPLLGGWAVLVLATAALLLLRGPYERGTGLGAALDPAVLRATATSRPGLALLARLVLLAAAALVLVRMRKRAGKGLLAGGGLVALGLALTWAVAEHASAGIQVPVAMTSSVLHLGAMAVWLGGLTALLTVLYRDPESLSAAMVARFSRLAFAAVTVLVVTGVYMSWRGLGSWSAFTDTSYGQILVAKLGAVVLLLAAAGVSRRWTGRMVAEEAPAVAVPARVPEPVGAVAARDDAEGVAPEGTADGPDPGFARRRTALRSSVLAEFTVGVVVLVVTTVLTGTLPGRAEADSAKAAEASGAVAPGEITASSTTVPFDVGTPNGHGKVQIDLSPGRVGKNSVQAVLFGPDGGIATVPELRLSFVLKARKIGPIDAKLKNLGGYWGTDTLQLPLAGTWTMRVTVRTTDIDQVTVEKTVRVAQGASPGASAG